MTATTRTVLAALAVSSGLAGLAGCGTDTGDARDTGDTAAGSSPRSSPAADPATSAPDLVESPAPRSLPGPGYTVPPVTTPLDVSSRLADPCGLLTPDQAVELQVRAGAATGDGSCRWQADAAPTSVLVVGLRPGSLTSFYEGYADSGDGSWEPTTVADLPGALVNGPFEASTGSCTLVLALSEDAYLRVERGTTPSQAEACSVATTAATLAVTTLGGGTR